MTEAERREAFVGEYRALCEKWGLAMSYDDGYVAHEVSSLADLDMEDIDWQQMATASFYG